MEIFQGLNCTIRVEANTTWPQIANADPGN